MRDEKGKNKPRDGKSKALVHPRDTEENKRTDTTSSLSRQINCRPADSFSRSLFQRKSMSYEFSKKNVESIPRVFVTIIEYVIRNRIGTRISKYGISDDVRINVEI